MNETEMSAYWFTLSAYYPNWTMPNLDDDAGLAIRSIWCDAFQDVSFADARNSIKTLPPRPFIPSLGELLAAATCARPTELAAAECFGKLRSVINSFGKDVDKKRAKCDAIDPNMWGTIQAMGGWDSVRNLEESHFNHPLYLKDWSIKYAAVVAGTQSGVAKRKGITGSIAESFGQIMQRRPEIEGGFA